MQEKTIRFTKNRFLDSAPRDSDLAGLGWDRGICIWTISQVMLMLLVHDPMLIFSLFLKSPTHHHHRSFAPYLLPGKPFLSSFVSFRSELQCHVLGVVVGFSSGSSRGEFVSLPFLDSRGCEICPVHIPWLVAPSLHLQRHQWCVSLCLSTHHPLMDTSISLLHFF